MRVACIALVIALGACQSWLGLDPTTAAADQDDDGVFDELDNCIAVANPDQRDFDADQVGDACEVCANGGTPAFRDLDRDLVDDGCDVCVLGPNDSDEDRDGTPDGCDNCPAVENGGQLDSDRDGVGDACDPASSKHTRRYFENFARDLRAWTTSVPWTIADGATQPTVAPGMLELYAVRLTAGDQAKLATPGIWSAAVGLSVPIDLPESDRVGVELFGDSFELATCTIGRAGDSFVLLLSRNASPGTDQPEQQVTKVIGRALDPIVELRIRRGVSAADAGSYVLECSLGEVVLELPLESNDRWRVRLHAGHQVRFTHVDTISNQ